jgi:putative addiction module component (TIGR02574 family)
MAQVTPQLSELLEKALALSTQDRGLLIDRLIASLDEEPAEEGVEAAWEEEIKRRMDDIRSGRVKTIPGEQVLRGIAEEFPNIADASECNARYAAGPVSASNSARCAELSDC